MMSSACHDNCHIGAVDEVLHSRQIYALGRVAQARIASSAVLLVGLNGTGAEVAKNIILAGINSLALVDNVTVSFSDLSSNFFVSEADIGISRAQASVNGLSQLNPHVSVSALALSNAELQSAPFLSQFQCVIFINQPLPLQLSINSICHANNIPFISSDCRGVFYSCFCDFGANFCVSDMTGEPPSSAVIKSITHNHSMEIEISEDSKFDFIVGDVVAISGTRDKAIDNQEVTIRGITKPLTVICESRLVPSFPIHGGYLNQIIQPTVVHFHDLNAVLNLNESDILSSGLVTCDIMKCDYRLTYHRIFKAIHAIESHHSGNASQLLQVVECNDDNTRSLLTRIARGYSSLIAPIASMIGGIVSQEVLKSLSGKFCPIIQMLYHDVAEIIDMQHDPTPVPDHLHRYESQVNLIGVRAQEGLMNAKLFLVGAGAIGCEMLKNWSMMGIACGPSGHVYLTDYDNVQATNLNRQLLHSHLDIGQSKSMTAANRIVQEHNDQFKITAYQHKAGLDSESIVFHDKFFASLDAVVTAVDTTEGRLYLDQRCVFYNKPLFDSGTHGLKGSTTVILPRLTENYGSTRDPTLDPPSYPICVIKNFPYLIDHTIAWAKEWFEGYFCQTCLDVNVLLIDGVDGLNKLMNRQPNMKKDIISRVHKSLVVDYPRSNMDCILRARELFELLFSYEIHKLLHSMPLDKVIPPNNTPFWSGSTKKPPAPLNFDDNNDNLLDDDGLTMQFITSVAQLLRKVYHVSGMDVDDWPSLVVQTLSSSSSSSSSSLSSSLHLPVFIASGSEDVDSDDDDDTDEEKAANKEKKTMKKKKKKMAEDAQFVNVDQQVESILSSIIAHPYPSTPLQPIVFDKDDDSHVEVIAAIANLRAKNYKIPLVTDLLRIRGIAGRIMPAIVTTTGLVSGAICLEMMKYLTNPHRPMHEYRNFYTSLALPAFISSEPVAASKKQIGNKRYSVWDKLSVIDQSGSTRMTIGQLCDAIVGLIEVEGAKIQMLNYNVAILYSDFMNPKKKKERIGMSVLDAVKLVMSNQTPPQTISPQQQFFVFDVVATVEDGDDDTELEVPSIQFMLVE